LTSSQRSNDENPVAVAALVRFVPLPDRGALKPRSLARTKDLGVHCPQCVDRITPGQRRRFAERQRPIEQARG